MLNWIWLSFILASVLFAGFTGRMADVSVAMLEGSKNAVDLVVGLAGSMIFMLGVMRVAFDGGLRDWIARFLAPLLRRLFPEIPPDHPAMAALVMNMASNMLGMGNAATPFGVKAMVEMDKLNRHPGTATDSMVLFLAINTSAIVILPPSGTIAVRLAAGSAEPASIWIPTLIATACSTLAAVTAFYLLRRLPAFRPRPVSDASAAAESAHADSVLPGTDLSDEAPREREPMGWPRAFLILGFVAAVAVALVLEAGRLTEELGAGAAAKLIVQTWPFPVLIVVLLLIGVSGRVPVYDSMIAGAREGLDVAVRIVPYLVAILAAVTMLRSSGLIDLMVRSLDPVTSQLGVPAEVLPMAILRPLSASGAFAVMSETLQSSGPDSYVGNFTSTLMGSTETTFYVLAVYFGAARITDGRHTLAACLTGDVAGFVGAAVACHLFFA